MDYIYDIEVFKNIFTLAVSNGEKTVVLEISERKNDLRKIKGFLNRCNHEGHRMVGFNNLGYDWPVLNMLAQMPPTDNVEHILKILKRKSDQIINTPWHRRFDHVIWDRDQFVQQVDLARIHHFDNAARLTSLKELEFNMQMESIEDLPFDPNEPVPVEGFDKLVEYNIYDVAATDKFYQESIDKIRLREELSEVYDCNMTNYSDAKIGEKILEVKLGRDLCYIYEDGERITRQTKRPRIALKDCIFDYVRFESEEFQSILDHFEAQTITETKGVFKDLHVDFAGVPYHFGTGGLHGCTESKVWESNNDYSIIDIDVTSYYPSLAIENQVFPAHLTRKFCDVYNSIKQERLKYPKGSPRNMALKLALNAAYGKSNDKFSFLYDPKFTMTITLNGQLLLCMLIEEFVKHSIEIIQANTDGVTVYCNKVDRYKLDQICQEWEKLTSLQLEFANYWKMVVRDVNNYFAVSD